MVCVHRRPRLQHLRHPPAWEARLLYSAARQVGRAWGPCSKAPLPVAHQQQAQVMEVQQTCQLHLHSGCSWMIQGRVLLLRNHPRQQQQQEEQEVPLAGG
jgi:hypothetical protein